VKDTLQRWLAANTLLPGVHACCIRFPDRASLAQVFGEHLKPDRLEQTWNTLSEMVPALQAQRLPPSRMAWSFEQGDLHFVLRPDGIALGLFTAPQAGDSPALQNLITEFLTLE
jgi:hypothetical protein